MNELNINESKDNKIYALRIYPDPILSKKSANVEIFDEELKKLVDDMFASMYYHEGVGLAAVQIGVLKNILVMDIGVNREDAETLKICLINPVIIKSSSEQVILKEGCLSLPGETSDVKRAEKITVKYQDVEGNFHELEAEGWIARCLLHEMDHLIGVVYIDHISFLKKNLIGNRLKKVAVQHAKERKFSKEL